MTTLQQDSWFGPVAKMLRPAVSETKATSAGVTNADGKPRLEPRKSLIADSLREIVAAVDSRIGDSYSVHPGARAMDFLRMDGACERMADSQLLMRCRVDLLICRRVTLQPCAALYVSLGGQPDPLGSVLCQACEEAGFPLLVVNPVGRRGFLSRATPEPGGVVTQVTNWLECSERESGWLRCDGPQATGAPMG